MPMVVVLFMVMPMVMVMVMYVIIICIIYVWTRLSSSANLGLPSQVYVLKRSSFLCSACVGAHENGVYTYIIIQCVNTSSWYCTVTSHYMYSFGRVELKAETYEGRMLQILSI